MKIIHKSLLCLVMCAAAGLSGVGCNLTSIADAPEKPATETTPEPEPEISCDPTIPEPPHPLPESYDWRPLAETWCAELETCGVAVDGCVDNYLRAIDEPVDDATPIAPSEVQADDVAFGCEDSEEYAADPAACAETVNAPTP